MIIDLDSMRSNEVLVAECLACEHRWVGVVPSSADPWTLECPDCGEASSRAVCANVTVTCARCHRELTSDWSQVPECFCEEER